MTKIMSTKEIAEYLRLHEVTICKYAAEGRIPAMRIGRAWRFNTDSIDEWIRSGSAETKRGTSKKTASKESGKKTSKRGGAR